MPEDIDERLSRIDENISTLLDNWSYPPTDEWELSEPFFVGGLASNTGASVYSCRAPFQGPCMWSVDLASAGATATHLVVGGSPKRYGVDFTGALVQSYQDSQFDALVIYVPANTTIPVGSRWYDLRNSENTLYVTVVANTNLAGANIQFRQKRKSK
jgi:hypothetical protein